MTTPAINLNQATLTDCATLTYNSSGALVGTVNGKAKTRLKIETRPASSTSRMGKSGWRQPQGWSHYLVEATPCPTSSFSVRDSRAPKSHTDFLDGAGWNETMSSLPVFPANLQARAEIKALLKLKNQKVNLAQAFFEREQTVRLFYETADQISKMVRAWRDKNPRRLWELVHHEGRSGAKIPRTWLQMQYGWSPLLADVKGSCDALRQRSFDGKAFRVSCVAEVREAFKLDWVKNTDQTGTLGLHVQGGGYHAARVHLDYVMDNPFLASLASLGITNPLLLAWELTPYSFVVDWFSDVGAWLNAADATLGWTFLGGTCTRYQKLEERAVSWSGSGKVSQYLTYVPTGPAKYSNRRMNMTRSVYSSSPLPRFPGFQNPLSTDHVANALALLVTAFRN